MVGTSTNSKQWRLRALCLNFHEDLWFGPEKEPEHVWKQRTLRAKAICKQCPVKSNCKEFSLRHGFAEAYGIWGGLDEWERLAFLVSKKRAEEFPRFAHLVCHMGHVRRPDTVYHAPRYSTCKICRAINDALKMYPETARTDVLVKQAIEKVSQRYPVETYPVQKEPVVQSEGCP